MQRSVLSDGTLERMVTILEREMYTEAAAARLLGVASATLHYWLEGGRKNGRTYQPVIREKATGRNAVTWAEFIEADLLRQYRRDHQIPMVEIRAFIIRLRKELGIPYPLAHEQPFVSGKKLVIEAQREAGVPSGFALVEEVGGQFILAPAAEQFFKRVVWSNSIATAWRPTPKSPVLVDPDVRFGRPTVGGISTEILAELVVQDEMDIEEVASLYDLTEAQVRSAVEFEEAARVA